MRPLNISPGDLEAVLAVARSGSFRAAATVLNLAQPSVSSRVRHAEAVLGVALFHRTTRKVTITEHGERLCMLAERTLADLRAVVQEFRDDAQLKRGRVVLGATPTIAGALLPGVIKRFTRRWPGVEVILRDDFFGRALDRVLSGEVDLALTPSQKVDPRFDFEPLFKDEVLVLAPLGHPLLRHRSVSISAVAKYGVVTMSPQTAHWGLLADAFAAEHVPFKPVFQTEHVLSIIAMIKSGLGVGFVPSLLTDVLDMRALGTLPVGKTGLFRQIGLVTAHGRTLNPAAMEFRDALRMTLKDRGDALRHQD